MVDVVSYSLISITCFCFGLIVSFQMAHIHYCRKLTILVQAINSHKNNCSRSLSNMKQANQKSNFYPAFPGRRSHTVALFCRSDKEYLTIIFLKM